METGGSLPHSQQPAICSYSEPDQSSLCLPPQFLKMKVIFSSDLRLVFHAIPFHQFPHKNPVCTHFLPPSPHTCYISAHHIRLDFITQIVFGGEYKACTSSVNILSHSPVTSSFIGSSTSYYSTAYFNLRIFGSQSGR